MAKKCTFVKLNNKTGKRAAMARHKSTKQSKEKTEKIRQDKLKRLREFNSWFK